MSQSLRILEVPVRDLKPSAYNPRRWSKTAADQLAQSIKRFGLVDPIICNGAPNRKNIVIGGHFRLKVAKDLGINIVPVVYLTIPDIEKEKELNLRLNKNVGEWDYELLKAFDAPLLADVGFTKEELAKVWDESLEVTDDEFNVEKELKAITKPQTVSGDIFMLGEHRLICGNSTDPGVIKLLLGKDTANMVYSDPPYNIGLDYCKGIGTKGKYGSKMTNDNKSDTAYKEFLKQTITNALLASKPDCHVFYYCDEQYIGMVQDIYAELGLTNRRVCLWLKNNQNPTPQVAFNKVYEPCVYATRGTPYLNTKVQNLNEVMNKGIGTGNALTDEVLDLFSIWLVKRLPGTDYGHPTEKPPTLHEKALRRCTKTGDVVLDLFGGSGSTLIACEQLKRHALLVEQEPIFCDLIIKRYEKLTGTKVKKIN